jgi:hypothetical protein
VGVQELAQMMVACDLDEATRELQAQRGDLP